MANTKIATPIHKKLQELLARYPVIVTEIIQKIDDVRGRALLVGGAVRDLMLGIEIKDLDIEVHGLTIEQLESLLRFFGPVSLVGKSFGVLRLHGIDIDWSLPRVDSAGRKPKVEIRSDLTMQEAFARRDLTMNAMGIDLITHELIDPFGGLQDMHDKILRVPDKERFCEDPLRFYRVMQFIARFEMVPDDELNALCSAMDISAVSLERIEDEFEKLLLKSRRPSLGIRWLHEIGRLAEIMPEIAALVGVPQNPVWHPEGDVFEHTMQALDAAAHLRAGYETEQEKLILMYAVLCHDIGKATTTKIIDGVYRSLGHEHEGAVLTPHLMRRLTRKIAILDAVKVLVKYHMIPTQLVDSDASFSSYKRLARALHPHTTLRMLADVCRADKRGRSAHGHVPLQEDDPKIMEFLARAQRAQVAHAAEEPVLLGRDLLDHVDAGPALGILLKRAYELQIEEGITDKQVLKERVLAENVLRQAQDARR